MATTKGGGPELMSTLNKDQKRLFKELGAFLEGKINVGAGEREGGLFTDREQAAFDSAEADFLDPRTGEGLDASITALIKSLSGSAAGTEEEVTKNFLANQARPLIELVNREILPGIDRTFRGTGSRRNASKLKVARDTAEALSASLQQAQFQTMQLNSQIMLNALGMSSDILQQKSNRTATFGTIAGSEGSAIRSEQDRLMPENNPFIQTLMNFAGLSTGQIVDMPSELTGFGQVLNAGTQIGKTASSLSKGATAVSGAGGLGGIVGSLSGP